MTGQTYTLDQARAEIARQECAQYGHDFSVISSRDMDGSDEPVSVVCDRCRKHWGIARKEQP